MTMTPVDPQSDQAAQAEPAWKPPQTSPSRSFWLLMFASLIGVGGLSYMKYRQVDVDRSRAAARQSPEPLPYIAEVPAFTLTDRTGKQVTLETLKGRIWVADFIFTHCAGPCPVMSVRMAELQKLLKQERMDDVVCVSFTVDPERDTPQRLAEYAESLGAEVGRWLFLTGEKKAIRELAIKGFMIAVEDPEQGDDQIIHSTRFVLVDRKGRIRGYYTALTEEEEIDPSIAGTEGGLPEGVRDDLLKAIRQLRREKLQ